MSSRSVYFCKIEFLNTYKMEDIVNKIDEYDFENDKLVIKDYNQRFIDIVYVRKTFSRESKFNVDKLEYEYVETSNYQAIDFSIDIVGKTLEIWASGNNIPRVVSILSSIFVRDFIVNTISVDIREIIDRLKTERVSFGKVKIKDVVVIDGIIASCIFNLKNHENPFDILNYYKGKITQISFSFKEENGFIISCLIANTGNIIIYKNKEDILDSTLDKIRSIYLGG